MPSPSGLFLAMAPSISRLLSSLPLLTERSILFPVYSNMNPTVEPHFCWGCRAIPEPVTWLEQWNMLTGQAGVRWPFLESWHRGWVDSASATWIEVKRGVFLRKLGCWDQRRGDGFWEAWNTDVGDRWVLVRRVQEPMGAVLWPPGPLPRIGD